MSPGTAVRIHTNLKFLDGCTGVVTDTPEFWEGLGFSTVAIDNGLIRSATLLDTELEVIGCTQRDGAGQGELFGGAP